MKLTTSDLEFKYKQIYEELESNGGELTPELEEALAINENDFEERVDNYFGIVTQNEGDIDKLKEQEKKIKRKIAAKTKVNAYIQEILNRALISTTIPTLTKTGYKTYKRKFPSLQLNIISSPSVSVDIVDMQKIADAGYGKYDLNIETDDKVVIDKIKEILPNLEIKSEFKPDKKTIGDKLKAEEVVEGAELFIKNNFSFT